MAGLAPGNSLVSAVKNSMWKIIVLKKLFLQLFFFIFFIQPYNKQYVYYKIE